MSNDPIRLWADVQTTTVTTEKSSCHIPIPGEIDVNDPEALRAAAEKAASDAKYKVAGNPLCADPADEQEPPQVSAKVLRVFPDTGFGEPDTNRPIEFPLEETRGESK